MNLIKSKFLYSALYAEVALFGLSMRFNVFTVHSSAIEINILADFC